MVTHKSILILEDDLKTLSAILDKLSYLEDELQISFSLMILTDYLQVQNYINKDQNAKFDIVLLDRDCKLGGSFHVLKMEMTRIVILHLIPHAQI